MPGKRVSDPWLTESGDGRDRKGAATEEFDPEGVGTEGIGTEGNRSEGIGGASAEGRGTEGQRSEGLIGASTEGLSQLVTGTLAQEQARFQGERDAFRRARPETGLHRTGAAVIDQAEEAANPVAALLANPDGLAQAVLLTEVLGKPRALRPYRRERP